jgi:predicted DNA-binding transcriptional regulator AlpA
MPESPFLRPEDRLTIEQVAVLLDLSPATLYRWRTEQRGPKAMRLAHRGRTRLIYPRAEVERWAREQLGYTSTRRQSA